jgi:pyruvate dehydrogenase E2 component (dihydrolipoamide acetyltransferase)
MAHAITVPRLGWSMEEGTFVRWLKRDGDTVRRGEPLFELEGDKALQEIEAVDEGILRIPPDAPQAGSDVTVGAILGYLVAEGEQLSSQTEIAAQKQNATDEAISRTFDVQSEIESGAHNGAMDSRSASDARLSISPRAKRIAVELGIDWTQLKGSGAGGRIRERDVRAAVNAGTQN